MAGTVGVNVGSLFSGIGGMDAGLAAAGHRHVFFCEQDEWRRQVLAARWPGVPIFDDVRTVGVESTAGAQVDGRVAVTDGAGRVHSVPVPDLICGGSPCQDLSVAGQRRGLAGERSGLFFEFARIIDAFRPGRVLFENVPGLFSSNGGRDFGVVIGTLADLGYGVAWRILDSRFFGVPQRRRRVFIVGVRADGDFAAAARRAGEILAVGSRCPGHPATRGEAREDVADASTVSTLTSSKAGGWRIGADEAAGGQLVANTLRSNERNTSQGPGNYVAHSLTSAGHDASEDGTGRGTPLVVAPLTNVRRLTPIECERLQGLPDDWTRLDEKTPDSRRYSGLGDAVTATVSEWIGRRIA